MTNNINAACNTLILLHELKIVKYQINEIVRCLHYNMSGHKRVVEKLEKLNEPKTTSKISD